ncbi:MAG: hypothetical protein A3F68_00710 [Acidobacteria bacterium RIFCSPLOWO2_12_FULL_54_10]|nr:MAG: hypothetical protein A3F68_00710 [Acidobacteria bacterium RIFCSPLOWO2_12_FULL_54_10]
MGRVLTLKRLDASRRRIQLIAIVGLVNLAGMAASAELIQRTFPVAANATLLLRSHSGKIKIQGWDQAQIEIKGDRASELVDVSIMGEEQKVVVQTHLTREKLSPDEARVDFEIRVPRQAIVRVESERGTVSVQNVEGSVTVETVSSSVELFRLKGNISARTMDGPIVIRSAEGRVTADSISGDISFAQVNSTELVGTTNAGIIRYEGEFGMDGSYVLNNYSSPIVIVTSNRASFDVTARAVSGSIENNLDIRPIPMGSPLRPSTPGKFLQGRFNGGRSTVKVSSYSGTIKLQGSGTAAASVR